MKQCGVWKGSAAGARGGRLRGADELQELPGAGAGALQGGEAGQAPGEARGVQPDRPHSEARPLYFFLGCFNCFGVRIVDVCTVDSVF